MPYKRPDGREPDEIRKIEAKVGIIKNADGSALFSFGDSKAIAAVYGPRQLHPQHLQNPEKCLLRCHYDMASFSVKERKKPGPTRRTMEISYITTKALEPVVQVESWPNTVIDVYIMIIQADASTRCAGINAAAMALANAGIPMNGIVSAVSIGKIGDTIVADLTKEEEDYCIVKGGEKIKAATDIPMAFMSKGEKITLLQLDGKITPAELKEAIALGKRICRKIAEIQIRAIKEIK